MKNIVAGVKRFQTDIFPKHKKLFDELASGQNPDVLFITCSDSRVDPCLITQTKPGELFISRNAGNIVPVYEPAKSGGITSSIEYAVAALHVKHIVVCGHTDCGAMKGALNTDALEGLPHTKEWIAHSNDAIKVIQQRHGCDCHENLSEDFLPELIEQNVVQQLEHLLTHPAVKARVDKGELEIHGWVYHIETGQVLQLAENGQFIDLHQSA
ncbi:MAG: carbonic anhydrase [Pseudomonadales bacterium]|nr:carbonic anhydrase [Pseudomonadales bacterium]